jgi:hypothetical protein
LATVAMLAAVELAGMNFLALTKACSIFLSGAWRPEQEESRQGSDVSPSRRTQEIPFAAGIYEICPLGGRIGLAGLPKDRLALAALVRVSWR